MSHPYAADGRGAPTRFEVRSLFGQGRVGGSMFGWRAGDPASPTKVLFLHGVGITLSTWRSVLPVVAREADCVAVDLLGFGRSRALPGSPVGMAAQTVVIEPLLDQLRWRRAVLVGHSMGGGVALGASLTYPRRVAGLVLVGSVGGPQPVPPFFRCLYPPGSAELLCATVKTGTRLGLGKFIGRYLSRDPIAGADAVAALQRLGVARALTTAIRDLRPLQYRRYFPFYREVTQPVLLIHGRHDNIVPPLVPQRLHRTLPGSELVWCERASHMPQESSAADVAGAIVDFLARRLPGGCGILAPGVE